jgi:hypothetical protein
VIITTSLYAGWEFENNADEMRGMTINSVGSGISYTNGIVGRATSYTITNGGISAGTTSDFKFFQSTGVFTICCWMRLTNYSANLLKVMCSMGALSSSTTGIGFIYDNRQLAGATGEFTTRSIRAMCGKSSGAMVFDFACKNAINDNDWHHVAVTSDHTTNAIYVDGVAQTLTLNNTNTTTSLDASANLVIGYRATNNDSKFEGDLSNLYFFNTMLSEQNIRRIMHTMHPFN